MLRIFALGFGIPMMCDLTPTYKLGLDFTKKHVPIIIIIVIVIILS